MANKKVGIKLTANISDFQSKMAKAQKSFKSFGKGMKNVGKSLTTNLTAPLLAIGTGTVMVAANFEKSMNKVKAVTGATGKEFDLLNKQAKDLGATTQFSASQAAEAMGFLGMAGFDTNQIMQAMPATLDLAAAGGLDLAQAADIASNILSGFGAEASEMGRFSDIMAKGFTSSNTSLEGLGNAMKMVAPVASGFGISIEESTAAIGKLSDAGIQGESAGTGLRGILATLSDKAGALGISVFDASGKMIPLTESLKKIEDKGLSTAKIMEVFGKKAGPSMLALLKTGSKGLKDFTGELENSGGTAKKVAGVQMEGLAGQMTILKSSFEGVAISIGTMLMPIVSKLMNFIKGLLDAWQGLDKGTKVIIITIAGVVAAIGPLMTAFGAIAGVVAAINLPIIAVIAGIAALVAAIMYAADNWEAISERANMAFAIVKNALISLLQFFIQNNIFSWLIDGYNKVMTAFGKEGIKNPFDSIAEKLEEFKSDVPKAETKFKNFFTSIKNSAAKAADAMGGLGSSLGVGGSTGGKGGAGGSITKGQVKSDGTGGGGGGGLMKVDYEIPEAPLQTFEDKVFNVMDGMAGAVGKFAEKWGTAISAAADLVGAALDGQQIKLDNYYNSEAEKIESSKMNEEQKKEALLKLDEKVAKKQAAINKKKAIAEKAMAMFQAVVSTAANVAQVIANPAMAVLVGALGAAQVAAIAAAPLPAMQSGGVLAAGQPALIGEAGPEIFQPTTGGMVLPNSVLGGMGQNVNVSGQFVVSGTDLIAAVNNQLESDYGGMAGISNTFGRPSLI